MASKNQLNLYGTIKQIFNLNIQTISLEVMEELDKAKKVFRYTNREIKKRIPAIVNFIGSTNDLYKDKYDEGFLIEAIGRWCASALPTEDIYVNGFHTAFAFAIWYLDEIVKVGHLDDIIDILPYEYANANAPIIDSLHSDELIERVAYVCENAGYSTGEEFSKLISTLNEVSPQSIEKAVDVFKNELYRLLTLFLSQTETIFKKRDSLEKEAERIMKSSTSILMVQPDVLSADRVKEIAVELENNVQAHSMLLTNFASIGVLKQESARALFGQAYCAEIQNYQIDDPFTICAAYHILRERGDDFYWIMGPSLTLYMASANRLPWAGMLNIDANAGRQYQDCSAQYEMKFNSDIFDGSKDKNRLVNEAQLFYAVSGGVIPPRIEKSFNSTKLILESNGLTGDDLQTFINKLRLLSPLAYDEDFQEDMDDFDEFDDEEDMDELDEPLEESEEVQDPTEKSLENEIKELKDRNRALTEELYVSNARARKMEKELLVQKSNMDVLQRELADLRNIIFNSQTGEFGEEKEGHLQIDYPYTAKSNVVVFGGHDSWAKAIKPLFTNVRFIHKDASPSSDMIRNADIVWIQTNALAHANFYKIIDVVRANNVPVRYFAFASATKCAEQIIVNDMG